MKKYLYTSVIGKRNKLSNENFEIINQVTTIIYNKVTNQLQEDKICLNGYITNYRKENNKLEHVMDTTNNINLIQENSIFDAISDLFNLINNSILIQELANDSYIEMLYELDEQKIIFIQFDALDKTSTTNHNLTHLVENYFNLFQPLLA